MKNKILFFALALAMCASLTQVKGDFGRFMKVQVLSDTETFTQTDANEYPLTIQYRYEIQKQKTSPIYLSPNEEEDIELTLKNTGKVAWDLTAASPNKLVLETYMPRSRKSPFLDSTTITIKDEDGKQQIKPDISTTFKFQILAPSSPGAYQEHFAPRIIGKKILNTEIITYDFVVEGDYSKSYKSGVENSYQKTVMSPDTEKEIELKIKNTGSTPWFNNNAFPIVLTTDENTAAAYFNGETTVAEMSEPKVDPGETATFRFNAKAPSTYGTYLANLNLEAKDLYKFETPIAFAIDVASKKVALTFDDGYGDINAFIDVLNENGVKGTFFMLGVVAQSRPDEMRRIVDEGHLLANHSYIHPDFRNLGKDAIIKELETTRQIMLNITGVDPKPYFRYPYGARNARSNQVIAGEGWEAFHWTNGTGDWKFHGNTAHGRQHVYYYATLNPPDEAIILMHVISQSTLAVLPDIIKYYKDNGYAFVTVDEL